MDHVWKDHLLDGRLVFHLNENKFETSARYKVFLENILKQFEENQIHYCKECREILSKNDVEPHIVTVHGKETYTCPALKCSQEFGFDKKQELLNHLMVSSIS
jgi:hypothetical protein